MYTPHDSRLALLTLAGCLAFGGVANAAPPPDPMVQQGMQDESVGGFAGTAPIHFISGAPAPFEGSRLGLSRLDELRGGDGSESNVLIDGLVDGNNADNINSGDNQLGGGAFGQAAGINTVIQNTGSNVLIQSGTAVSVQFTSPTP